MSYIRALIFLILKYNVIYNVYIIYRLNNKRELSKKLPCFICGQNSTGRDSNTVFAIHMRRFRDPLVGRHSYFEKN